MSGFTSLQSSDTYQVFLPNENTAYSGGQANGLSYSEIARQKLHAGKPDYDCDGSR